MHTIRVTMPTIMCECVQASMCMCVHVCGCVCVLHDLQLALSTCYICIPYYILYMYIYRKCSHFRSLCSPHPHTHTHTTYIYAHMFSCYAWFDLKYIYMISLLLALLFAPYVATIYRNLASTISPYCPTAAVTLPWTKPAYPSIMVSNMGSLC